jgi:hypothetical protein
MALFIDGQINTLLDLVRYEAGLLETASTEQVDITAKTTLAQDITGAEILVFLLKNSWRDPANYLLPTLSGAWRRAKGVSDVVVTEPLKRWHALKTLELVYQDAYYNQLNDRYQGKWTQYQQRAQVAADQLYQIGVGLVHDPLPQPASPLLYAVSGQFQATEYYVRITWVNSLAQESAASDVVALQTVDSTTLVVSPVSPPANATGWNVYGGSTPVGVTLQNDTPIAAGTDWMLGPRGIRSNKPVGSGQSPERYIVNDRVSQRG